MNENNDWKSKSTSEEEALKRVQPAKWKKIFKKKWFFPALYLVAAALILAFIAWYPNPNDYALDDNDLDPDTVGENWEDTQYLPGDDVAGEDALPVSGQAEEMKWPVADEEDVHVALGFFDDEASEEEQQAAMVEYDRTFHPHTGIDLVREDGESFDVRAALSGTVIKSEKDPLVGYQVHIEHEDNLVTIYQSLEDVQVSEGDEVSKGEPFARAGRNTFEQELGVHLHFEVREEGVAVNPEEWLTGTASVSVQDGVSDEASDDTSNEATNNNNEQSTTNGSSNTDTNEDMNEDTNETMNNAHNENDQESNDNGQNE